MSADALPLSPVAPFRLRLLRLRGDDALRALAATGDADAFAVLYERHHQALYRYCRSIVGHDEDAHDALHNACANAWAALQRGDRDVPVRPWLFRIAHNEAVSLLRRRRAHADLAGHEDIEGASLEQTVEMRERLATLQADLGELPERQRAALLLRELCGLRHEEIAVVFGVSAAAAKQRIYEARVGLNDAALGRAMRCDEVQRLLSDGDRRVARGRRVRAHLRACPACRSFHRGLRRRPVELRALAPPLPLAAGAGLLARLLPFGGAPAAMTAGKLAGGVAVKAILGTALLATAGITTVAVEHHRQPPPRPGAAQAAGARSGGAPAVAAHAAAAPASPLAAGAPARAARARGGRTAARAGARDGRRTAAAARPANPATRPAAGGARPGRIATGAPVAPPAPASTPASPPAAAPATPAAGPPPAARLPHRAGPASPPSHASPPAHAQPHGARPSAPPSPGRPARPGHSGTQGRHGAAPSAGASPGAFAHAPGGAASKLRPAPGPPADPTAAVPDAGRGPVPGHADAPPGQAGGGPPVGRGRP